ncbi:DinB family protein [Pedobacter sp. BMA]|uniref:DinB family protein n=1 Tax=Pedobacter sp. BMA TaxID=1663685 RepID=UPI00064A7259|nr:DinB family protein [Pedobacter sp. BMA]KLT65472.1 ABC transporter [Pedobacter sp. BMA]
MEHENILITELKKLINGGTAHAGFEDAVADLPFELTGERPYGLPYSIWQLAEHIRIAQWDMLEFSKDGNHQSPKWPEEYWPKETAPANSEAWENCLKQIDQDRKAFINLIDTQDLFASIPRGTGQNILREALQVADHNAYHIAEIIVVRRLLGAWKS